ncbi:hypothetical protein PBRA_004629 [Plasmodiophora brassicae]|nr:hypothetical protein PBRA_004629 [Plasmodiophora brassicae]
MQRVTLQPAVPADRELDEAIAVILDGIVGELVLERILTDSKTAAIDNLAYDVSRIWSAPRSHVHVMKFNQDMTTDILLCLRDGVWLNDEVMNFHISMMQERNQERLAAWPGSVPSVFFHNSFFYAKLAPDGQYRYANVARWTKRKRVDIFAVDLVMFPVHVGESHWCLGVIDMMNKQIAYYDSLGGDNRAFFANARRYVADEHADKKGSPLDTSVWTDVLPGSVPRQNNGCDCGVFTLKFADFLSDGLPLTFHQSDMPYFRRRCAKEITVGRLL